ncbi:hypothetical protein HDU97_006508 [Phlyctochytrium planicorne]|nr:hypothetical protein HDU97_006508 [Phlyctochytrium planicorne]
MPFAPYPGFPPPGGPPMQRHPPSIAESIANHANRGSASSLGSFEGSYGTPSRTTPVGPPVAQRYPAGQAQAISNHANRGSAASVGSYEEGAFLPSQPMQRYSPAQAAAIENHPNRGSASSLLSHTEGVRGPSHPMQKLPVASGAGQPEKAEKAAVPPASTTKSDSLPSNLPPASTSTEKPNATATAPTVPDQTKETPNIKPRRPSAPAILSPEKVQPNNTDTKTNGEHPKVPNQPPSPTSTEASSLPRMPPPPSFSYLDRKVSTTSSHMRRLSDPPTLPRNTSSATTTSIDTFDRFVRDGITGTSAESMERKKLHASGLPRNESVKSTATVDTFDMFLSEGVTGESAESMERKGFYNGKRKPYKHRGRRLSDPPTLPRHDSSASAASTDTFDRFLRHGETGTSAESMERKLAGDAALATLERFGTTNSSSSSSLSFHRPTHLPFQAPPLLFRPQSALSRTSTANSSSSNYPRAPPTTPASMEGGYDSYDRVLGYGTTESGRRRRGSDPGSMGTFDRFVAYGDTRTTEFIKEGWGVDGVGREEEKEAKPLPPIPSMIVLDPKVVEEIGMMKKDGEDEKELELDQELLAQIVVERRLTGQKRLSNAKKDGEDEEDEGWMMVDEKLALVLDRRETERVLGISEKIKSPLESVVEHSEEEEEEGTTKEMMVVMMPEAVVAPSPQMDLGKSFMSYQDATPQGQPEAIEGTLAPHPPNTAAKPYLARVKSQIRRRFVQPSGAGAGGGGKPRPLRSDSTSSFGSVSSLEGKKLKGQKSSGSLRKGGEEDGKEKKKMFGFF